MIRAIGLFAGFAAITLCTPAAPASPIGWPEGDPIVNHPPHPFGGLGSDTEFRDDFNVPVWQRVADDILLSESATVARIVAFGFYGNNVDPPPPEPPPATETLRVRFYDARPADNLPGVVLFEESIVDPVRTPTGNVIACCAHPPEYQYQFDLATPFNLAANTLYWQEIVQVGDLESHFRWEFSIVGQNGIVTVNWNHSDWQYSTLPTNNAFALWTIPEPTSIAVFALLSLLFRGRTFTEPCS